MWCCHCWGFLVKYRKTLPFALFERLKKSLKLKLLELVLLLAKFHLGIGEIATLLGVCILTDNICCSKCRVHVVQWEHVACALQRIVSNLRGDFSHDGWLAGSDTVFAWCCLFGSRSSKDWTLAATSFFALFRCHGKAPCFLSTDKPWVAVRTGCVPILPRVRFSDEPIKV